MMGLPSLRFRVGSIPVQIELFFFLSVLILGIPESRYGSRWLLLWAAVAIVSVLAQELVHAFALLRLRRHPEVVLHSLGSLTVHTGVLTAWQRIGVHLIGPVTMLAIVGIPARIWYESGPSSEFLFRFAYDLYWVNFWWAIVNIVPIWPLHGGQAFAGVTALRSGRINWPVVHWVSIVVAAGGGLYALVQTEDNLYVFLLGVILAVQNFLRLRGSRAFLHPGYDAGEGSLAFGAAPPRPPRGPARPDAPPKPPRSKGKPTERLARGYAALQRGECELARTEAEQVRAGRSSPTQAAMAAEIIAWSYLQERNVPRARSALADLADRSALSRCLLASLEITAGDQDRGLAKVADALVHEPDGPAKRQAIDYVGRRGLGVDLARHLLDLPNGEGFDAAVRLVGVLAECGRREQADKVSDLLFGG
jgi:Zn-dependent protease